MGEGAPCSRGNLLCWSELAYWKFRKKQVIGTTTNEESMERKKRVATITDDANTIEEIEVELERVQGNGQY